MIIKVIHRSFTNLGWALLSINYNKIKRMRWNMSKVWLIALTSLLIVLIGVGGYFLYTFYEKYKNKKDEIELLQSEITNMEINNNEVTKDTQNNLDECDHGLTPDEETIISTWDTYNSSTYNYSFRYPSDWTLDVSNPTRVNIRDESEDGEGIFNVYSDEAAIMGFSEYTVDSRETIEIDCTKATLINFSFDSDGRVQVTSFNNNSTKHITMFSYEYQGASHASDMQYLGKLILKTMELN